MMVVQSKQIWKQNSSAHGGNLSRNFGMHFMLNIFCNIPTRKQFPHCYTFVRNTHQSAVDSTHTGTVRWSILNDIFVSLNSLLNKQWGCQWFEMIWGSCHTTVMKSPSGECHWSSFDDKSTFIDKMTWYHQTATHHLNQHWPNLSKLHYTALLNLRQHLNGSYIAIKLPDDLGAVSI